MTMVTNEANIIKEIVYTASRRVLCKYDNAIIAIRCLQYDFFIQYCGDRTRDKRKIAITEDGHAAVINIIFFFLNLYVFYAIQLKFNHKLFV